MSNRLKIITLVCNHFEDTDKMLYSLHFAINELLKNTLYYNKVQLSILDNGSKEKFTYNTKLTDMPPRQYNVEVIRSEENLMFAKGNNKVLKEVTNEDVLLLNNDVIVHDHFLTKIVKQYNIIKRYAKVGIVGPMTNRAAGLQQTHICDAKDLTKMQTRTAMQECFGYSWGMNKVIPRRVLWITGFAMFISNDCLKEVGLLDDKEFPLSGEDIDYCYRAGEKGYGVWIDQSNFIWHTKHVTANDLPNNAEDYWRNANIKMKKKYPELFPRQTCDGSK
jgi:GT2 family glycosyltransferase